MIGNSEEEANSCEALDQLLTTDPEPAAAERVAALSATLMGIVRAVEPICIAASGKLAATIRAARPMWIGAALIVLSGLFSPGLDRTKRPATTSPRNTGTLSFRVERSAGEFLLTWNRDADVIHEATQAVLAIADGERQQSVDLDQAQLRHGRIVYLSYNPEINFQLKVTGRRPSQTQSESVRVLRVSPWATPAPSASPPKPVPMRMRAANAVAHISSKASAEPGAEFTKAPNEAVPQADDLAQTSGSASSLDLPDAPGLTSGPQAQAVSTPSNIVAPAETQVSLFQLLPTAAPDIPEPTVGGQVSEAQILAQRSPEYPLTARQTRVSRALSALTATVNQRRRCRILRSCSMPRSQP
jgi:hypothetical protein